MVPPAGSLPGEESLGGVGGREEGRPTQASASSLRSLPPCSAFLSCVPQVSPHGHPGPHGASVQLPVGLPVATGAASARGPPPRTRLPWCCHPHQPGLLLFAQAPTLRRSPASCQGVTVSPLVPRIMPSMLWGYALPCTGWPPALANTPPPDNCFLGCHPRSWGLGALGALVQL